MTDFNEIAKDKLRAIHGEDAVPHSPDVKATIEKYREDITRLRLELDRRALPESITPNPDLCPPDIVESLQAYIKDGRPQGDFVKAVICNDLSGAFGHADANNMAALPHIVAWCYWNLHAPHGNEAVYNKHIEAKRKEREES